MSSIMEAREEYREALRKGRSSYYQSVFQGKPGILPTLQGVMEHAPLTSEIKVGLEEVPLRKIIGTEAYSRARAFSRDFMPLLKSRSEFGEKWSQLFLHHLNEGISEPVVLKEYLNWYWVVEGNKRVSVLKYLGAAKIEAAVTRLLPPKDMDDPVVGVYYRFLMFKEKTRIGDIWIRYPDGYERLLSILKENYRPTGGRKQGYRSFRTSIYLPFREVFKEEGGDALPLTTGEAFLRFCEIVGFPEDPHDQATREQLAAVIKELSVTSGDVAVGTETITASEPSIMGSLGNLILPSPLKRIAFVHYETAAISEWTRLHEEGRMAVALQFPDRIETKAFSVSEPEGDIESGLRKAAEYADVVIVTAAILYPAARKTAISFPDVRFLVASRHQSGPFVRTFSPRAHEVLYLAGVAAGALSETDLIGYVDNNYSNYAHATINAFTLGVRASRPQARVRVTWSYRWDEPLYAANCATFLEYQGAGLIFQNTLPRPEDNSGRYGLYAPRKDDETVIHYADLSYDWREFYVTLVENILNRGGKEYGFGAEEKNRFMTYWGGIRNGIVKLRLNRAEIPPETVRLIDGLRTLMELGEFNPFTGPVSDNQGKLRIPAEHTPGFEEIIGMDWLVNGIDGPVLQADKILTQ